jgi:phosphoribosylanthranilate isomerase
MNQLFRIKICGLARIADAHAAVDAGADAIGLNFYARSPRFVSADMAHSIATSVGGRLCVVGVFVNADAKTICDAVHSVPLHAVQLHGDETPEFLSQLKGVPTVRALRPRNDFAEVASFVARCRELHAEPRMVLIDAWNSQTHGGTGERADWSLVNANRSAIAPLPLALAGGLTAENVAVAIQTVRPDAVDTASGVEIAPGQKSAEKIAAFVRQARQAFAGLHSNG